MKLFKTLSALALVKAQLNEFTNLNQLFESLQANLLDNQANNEANESVEVPAPANVSVNYLSETEVLLWKVSKLSSELTSFCEIIFNS